MCGLYFITWVTSIRAMEHGTWSPMVAKYYQADSWSWRTLGSPWGRDVEFLHRTPRMEHDIIFFVPVHDPDGHKSQAAFSSTLFKCPISVVLSHHGLCPGLSPSIRYIYFFFASAFICRRLHDAMHMGGKEKYECQNECVCHCEWANLK